MSYFLHLYKWRMDKRKRECSKPYVEKYGDLKAATFAKLYRESNEWNDLRDVTERGIEYKRKMSMVKLAELREGT